MRVQITERRCEVPADVRRRAESQAEGLERFDSRATAAEVTFSEERHERSVELIIHIDGAPVVVGRGEAEDFRSALDRAVERARRQLKEGREQRRDHRATPLSDNAVAE